MRLFKQTPEDYYNAPYDEFPALIRGTVVVVMAILWAFSKLMWRWKVEDADLLFERKEGRGSVVICNHTSMAELLAVETALFFGGRRVRPIFKSEFAKSKIVRWAFSRVGGIPVERGTADMKCRPACAAARRGRTDLPRGHAHPLARDQARGPRRFCAHRPDGQGARQPARHLRLVRHHACGQKAHAPQEVLDSCRQGRLAFRCTGRAQAQGAPGLV